LTANRPLVRGCNAKPISRDEFPSGLFVGDAVNSNPAPANQVFRFPARIRKAGHLDCLDKRNVIGVDGEGWHSGHETRLNSLTKEHILSPFLL
jgi:hypothetical protein